MNMRSTSMICEILGIKTPLLCSTDIPVEGHKDDRIIHLCQKLGASVYLSGPAAQDYIVDEKFQKAGIDLVYKDYTGYPEYPQLFPPFEHAVSVLDLLFNCGPDAPYYIWGWRESDHELPHEELIEIIKKPIFDSLPLER